MIHHHDVKFMRLALKEAKKGLGRTSPNPCVGSVIVQGDSLVGRGYHRKAGTPHAEVNAITDAGYAARGATMYVTLEPCNHTGQTPPCTKAVLDAGISRVVVGMSDPNPGVSGGGSSFLRSQGITVDVGVLERECRAINRPFIKHCTTGLPWMVMKAGMSLDGRITRQRGSGGQITGEQSRLFTHRLRDTFDAILIGIETARIDDPSLTTRLPDGNGRDPIRIILDTSLKLDPLAKMLQQGSPSPTWIFCGLEASLEREQNLSRAGAVVHRVASEANGGLDLHKVLSVLGQADINSVLVEGGASIHGSMLRQGLVDQAYLFMAPFFIGQQGTPLIQSSSDALFDFDDIHLTLTEVRHLGDDILIQGLVNTIPDGQP